MVVAISIQSVITINQSINQSINESIMILCRHNGNNYLRSQSFRKLGAVSSKNMPTSEDSCNSCKEQASARAKQYSPSYDCFFGLEAVTFERSFGRLEAVSFALRTSEAPSHMLPSLSRRSCKKQLHTSDDCFFRLEAVSFEPILRSLVNVRRSTLVEWFVLCPSDHEACHLNF